MQVRYLFLNFLFCSIRQCIELFRAQHFFVFSQGGESKSRRGLDQRYILFFSLFTEFVQGDGVTIFQFLLNFLRLCPVFVTVKSSRYDHLDLLYKLFHVLFETDPHSWRQAQGRGFMGLIKIIDIAPVRCRSLLRRGPGDYLPDRGELARAGRTEGEQIVAAALDADSKIHGIEGAVLSDHHINFFQFLGGIKVMISKIT